ncbi:hypothetical protein MASR1M12_27910 [Erysipelotrichia bacterium]
MKSVIEKRMLAVLIFVCFGLASAFAQEPAQPLNNEGSSTPIESNEPVQIPDKIVPPEGASAAPVNFSSAEIVGVRREVFAAYLLDSLVFANASLVHMSSVAKVAQFTQNPIGVHYLPMLENFTNRLVQMNQSFLESSGDENDKKFAEMIKENLDKLNKAIELIKKDVAVVKKNPNQTSDKMKAADKISADVSSANADLVELLNKITGSSVSKN